MLTIIERWESDVTVFLLHGRVDLFGAGELESALNAARTEGKLDVLLDMAGVEYISSAGIRTLAEAVARCRDSGGDLKLVGVNDRVQRVLRIIGLDTFFSPHKTLQAAVADY